MEQQPHGLCVLLVFKERMRQRQQQQLMLMNC